MLAVLRNPTLSGAIDPCLPRGRSVHGEWQSFEKAIPDAHCLIVALDGEVDPAIELSLGRLGEIGSPPVILVLQADQAALDLLSRIKCFGATTYAAIATRLPELIETALEESPRRWAAAAIIDALEPDPLERAIVQEILLAKESVRSTADLAERLGFSLTRRQLRDRWRAARPASNDMTLERLIRWGPVFRILRHSQHLDRTPEIAFKLRVDEATLYRDVRDLLGRSFKDRPWCTEWDAAQLLLWEWERIGAE